MTLVDTSVWIDHFRRGNAGLRRLLEDGEVTTHPMVLGELACGNLARRSETLRLLGRLPSIRQAPDGIVLQAIESLRLWGKGIGWIDAHPLGRFTSFQRLVVDPRPASGTALQIAWGPAPGTSARIATTLPRRSTATDPPARTASTC